MLNNLGFIIDKTGCLIELDRKYKNHNLCLTEQLEKDDYFKNLNLKYDNTEFFLNVGVTIAEQGIISCMNNSNESSSQFIFTVPAEMTEMQKEALLKEYLDNKNSSYLDFASRFENFSSFYDYVMNIHMKDKTNNPVIY